VTLYCTLRHFRPRRIVEVGSGFSTRLAARAAGLNEGAVLVCVEPHPDEILKTYPGVSRLVQSLVQQVELELFEGLETNDNLFIDSTHVARTGSDVPFLFLQALPRLQKGVLVHDIFLTRDYPQAWIKDFLIFSNKHYLFQAFLSFNSRFAVLFSSAYLTIRQRAEMERAFSAYLRWEEGCSFWIRRKTASS